MKKLSSLLVKSGLALLLLLSGFSATELGQANAQESAAAPYRLMESLNRAPVAVKTDNGIFISWRLLGTDPSAIAFNLYRDGVLINASPIVQSTNYVDAAGTNNSVYEVRAVLNGIELPSSDTTSVWNSNYVDIPLRKPANGATPDGEIYTYNANDISVGDLDGDGQYELIVKWDPSNSKDNSQAGYTGNVYLDAYKLDGTFMWRIDMGRNIRAGAHYTQFMVYDFDGDGRAEIAAKTADGTVDGGGMVIGDPNADYRNSTGYVLSGPEFLTVFDGLTGRAMSTVNYDPPRGNVNNWGDNYGNRVDRFLAAVAYLDGERPSFIMARGYYTRTVLAAYNWRDGQLTQVWKFDSDDPGNSAYAGQGNHNLSVADVDGDGKDEIVYGAMTLDDDGTPLYNTKIGHGDALHVGDFDPSRPGLEVFKVSETYPNAAGIAMWDAATGELIWNVATNYDVGRGTTGDIDPRYPGAESWAVGSSTWNDAAGGIYTTKGEKISSVIPAANFVIWWDGDLLREILDHNYNESKGVGTGKIQKWDYENQKTVDLLVANGTYSNNGTKGNPGLQADLLGDWREEVIWRLEDSSALRLYTTTDVTEHRIYTLMHDPEYRLSIAWQNVAYNQPPHTSFYLGVGMDKPPVPRIVTKLGNGSVSGWVGNGGGARVNGTTVTVEAGGASYSTTTNAHGYYSLQNIPLAGNVVMTANKAGCEPGSAVINLKSSQAISQDLNINCPITGVTVTPTNATLLLGKQVQLNATVLPDDANRNNLKWVSSNPAAATVNDNGLVTAVALGQATISAYSSDNPSIVATSVITVEGIKATGLQLNKSVLNMLAGTSKQIIAAIKPADAYNQTIHWSTSDSKVAAVDGDGLVSGIAPGTAVITATAEDGGFTETTVVNVQTSPIAVTDITLDRNAYYFASDYFSELNPSANQPTVRLAANVVPSTATNNDVVWSTSDASIAIVDQFGNVTALKPGAAEIKATTAEGQYSAFAKVYVPVVSESFDNRSATDAWGSKTGTAGGSGNLGGAVTNLSGNHVFQVSGGGTGVRSTQKAFTTPAVNNRVLLDFDWNVGNPTNSPAAQLSIEDSAGNRYMTLQYASGQEMVYDSGGKATNAAVTGTRIGSGFNVNNALYRVQVSLDFVARTMSLSIVNKSNSAIAAQIDGIPFHGGTTFSNDVGKLQFTLVRTSNTSSWTSWIDNFNIYALNPVLTPLTALAIHDAEGKAVDGLTLNMNQGEIQQLAAVIEPSDASYRSAAWRSSNPNAATVDPHSGLVTAIGPGDAEITLEVDAYADAGGALVSRTVNIHVEGSPNIGIASAVISGPETVLTGQPINLTIGVADLTGEFRALDVMVNYEADKLEFDSIVSNGHSSLKDEAIRSLQDNFHVLATEIWPDEGKIRIIMVGFGETGVISEAGNLLELHGQVKADAATGSTVQSLSDFQVSLDGEDLPVDLSRAAHTLTIGLADLASLHTAIDDAQGLYDSAQEGTQAGQYPAGSKALLLAAIVAALQVKDNATQVEVSEALRALNAAITSFLNSVNGDPSTEADLSALILAIDAAQSRYDNAAEGVKVGQYRAGAKSSLLAAINAALSVKNIANPTQAQVDTAKDELNDAVQQFRMQLITLAGNKPYLSIGDLSIMVKYYGITSSDPKWSEIEQADLFDEGEIGLRALAGIARMILEGWN